MRDRKKFGIPKIKKNPEVGDIVVNLNCGKQVSVDFKDFNRIKKQFKHNSVYGSAPNKVGNLKVLHLKSNKLITVDSETYATLDKNQYVFQGVVGEIDMLNPNLESLLGSIIVKNNLTSDNIRTCVSYDDWLQLGDEWDFDTLVGVGTNYDNENAPVGSYVIMSNGVTVIIDPQYYTEYISNHWEHVDTIPAPKENDD